MITAMRGQETSESVSVLGALLVAGAGSGTGLADGSSGGGAESRAAGAGHYRLRDRRRTGYAAHHLTAKAVVSFTAPPNLEVVNFGFHPALKVTKITDESGKLLEAERTADGSIRVTPGAAVRAGPDRALDLRVRGHDHRREDGPIEGLKLAAIQEPISYLLYAARWFPTTGYMTDRFTAEMHIRVPQGMKVFASGAEGASKSVTLSNGKPGDEFTSTGRSRDFREP
jgi:hypothetical protein